MKAINIRAEHLHNPIGVDIVYPYISWNCQGGKQQTAYEVEVFRVRDSDAESSAGENRRKVWETGKVSSSAMSTQIQYEAGSRNRIYYRIRLWDETDTPGEWSGEQFYEMGLLSEKDWSAEWINPELNCDPEAHKPASYLRTTFEAKKGRQARLYITCHGLYEAYINGQRAGDFVLAPGSYDYSKHIAYQTYDVTGLLAEGQNEVQVILGDGWYRSVSGVDGDRNLYGQDIALLFQLEVDGHVVCRSDENWQASQEGPLRENDMQQGETVDARITEPGNFHEVKVEHFPKDNLTCSNALPIRERERYTGKLIATPNRQKVLDFGQNLAGYVEITLTAKAGQKLTLSAGETLDENGNFTQENFQDRKRHKEGGTNQRVTYTCRDGENHYKSRFTIWGFRYVLVETDMETDIKLGSAETADRLPPIDLEAASFTAIAVYSDMAETAAFTCSDERINQLFSNCMWSMKSNFCDVPTDCPTRERAAWTGDMGVFIDTGLTLMDCYTVVRKWLAECRLAQYEDGRIANIAPRNNNPGFFSGLLAGSVGWGDACILVPYAMYQRTGDTRILTENYEMMTKWYAYLQDRAKKKPANPIKRLKKMKYRDYIIETGVDYGEWCEPDVESTSAMRTPQGKIATAYLSYSGKVLSEIANVLGKAEDADRFMEVSEKAKLGFREIAAEDGRIRSDRQADYVRAITFDLLSEEEKVTAAKDLNDLVVQNQYHPNTGFLSTPDLCRVLADYGYVETAYKVLLSEDMPGWLYEVKKGATTIWENWNGIDEDGKPSASLNHYSKGAIAGWLVSDVCGIQLAGGKLTIAPKPDPSLAYVKAVYHSPYGTIESGWEYEDGEVKYHFTIPANVEAEVIYPDGVKEKMYG